MHRLLHVIVFTPDIAGMRTWYRDELGLETGIDSPPHWVDFKTSGALLGLHPTHPGLDREIQLSFQVKNLADEVRAMRARGVVFDDAIKDQPYGRQIHLRDPEGRRLSLNQPNAPVDSPGGPALRAVILNVHDLPRLTGFYRDQLGIGVNLQQPHWVELDTGDTRVALHARARGEDRPLHAAAPVAPCFEVDDLGAWADELRERGVELATAPTEEEFGVYAEVMDLDGNVIVFREPQTAPTLEEALAAPFEDGEVTHTLGMRRRATKLAKAVSRVAVRPEYRKKKTATGKPLSATTMTVAKVRGMGPNHTRLQPKKTADERKAKVKPMQGHKKKADSVRATRQRTAGAAAGKSKPVKRASARRARPS